MTENSRIPLYGAQHPLAVVPCDETLRGTEFYIVPGHECESGSILTPAPGDPEALQPRKLLEAKIGDLLVTGATGAYCAAMSNKNYNSFPEAGEVLVDNNGEPRLIRGEQTLDQMVQNEMLVI